MFISSGIRIGAFMKYEKEEAARISYPAGSRLYVYERLLDILYRQNKISRKTYQDSTKHVEKVIEKRRKQ